MIIASTPSTIWAIIVVQPHDLFADDRIHEFNIVLNSIRKP
ncbi:MAG: hypothetical protein ACREXS_16350 [Gammaproteobacteria bacterium]